ncbi:MAG: hypothetical protein QOK00_271, partial [Thermoleophilaceae bacterium]|nr:hypothetical protein [Thermoleophilaceae bacterium]
AYRTDRLSNVEPTCPKPDGDAFCREVSYQPLLTIAPASGGGGGGGGSSTGIIVVIAVVVLGGLAFLVVRRRGGRGGREPLELET